VLVIYLVLDKKNFWEEKKWKNLILGRLNFFTMCITSINEISFQMSKKPT